MIDVPVMDKKAGGDETLIIGFQRYDDRKVHVKYRIERCFTGKDAYHHALFLLNRHHGDTEAWVLSDHYTPTDVR